MHQTGQAMSSLIWIKFFLRFWQKTGDALFVAFSAAFLLFAINKFFLALQADSRSPEGWPFFFSLAGFGLLILPC